MGRAMLGKRGTVMVLVVIAAVSAACGTGGTTTRTTPTPSSKTVATAAFEADKTLIVALWRGLSDTWGKGETPEEINAGFQGIVDATYPGSGVTVASCKANVLVDPSIEVAQFKVEETVDPSTIERDDGWVVPGGELDGTAPQGDIYTMSVRVILTVNRISEVRQETVHVTVLDHKAYHFPGCL
jgi:hypothetical protein